LNLPPAIGSGGSRRQIKQIIKRLLSRLPRWHRRFSSQSRLRREGAINIAGLFLQNRPLSPAGGFFFPQAHLRV
jgi:hypothetical protein